MEHTADNIADSNLPSQKRTTFRTTILFLVAIGTIAGLLFAMMRDTPVSCPDELIGAWKTAAAGYENGMLVITSNAVVFTAGGEHLEAQALRRVETTQDGPHTFYTLVFGPTRSEEQTLSFYYHTRDRTITFKNQSNLVWTRASVES
jgi:hypothetical protein